MKKVLILDDEKELLGLWHWHFKLWGQEVEIITAENGAEGVNHLEKGKFDLILTDFSMPGMNGYEFIQHVRSTDSKTPIILFSGYIPEIVMLADRHENVMFFEKPLIGGKLRKCVEMILRGEGFVIESS